MTDYPIGTRYLSSGKAPKECEIVDILKTYNSKGELVKTRYVAAHQFIGQTVTDYDVCAVSIARGLIKQSA